MAHLGTSCAPFFAPEMVEPNGPSDDCCDYGDGDEGVGDSAVVLQSFDGASQAPEDVKVSGLRCEHGGQRGVDGFAIETGASDASAGKEVGDWLHSALDP